MKDEKNTDIYREYKPSFVPICAVNLHPSLRFEAIVEGCIVLREGCSEKVVRGSNSNNDASRIKKIKSKMDCWKIL